MYEIKVREEFSGAHNLRNYKGKCEELHGHNWKIEVAVTSGTLDKKGMVMDFNDLKKFLRNIISSFDHKYLNDLAYFKKENPTSENIARFIQESLSRSIKKKKIKVSVWETDNSCASYEK
ncbi:MAG: 6-carboxytetrahydropterin synthase QueD [Candidatus Omnitrophica bacterium]|nr:6-carboxytetrahydropterin synthase QueD [Candidatus Omnitrophota bacterium]